MIAFDERTHRDLSTRETRRGIKANTVTARAAIYFDLTSVGLEVLGCVFRCDTALNSIAALRDCFLGETELRECRACCDLNLRGDDVDARDFLLNFKFSDISFSEDFELAYQ